MRQRKLLILLLAVLLTLLVTLDAVAPVRETEILRWHIRML